MVRISILVVLRLLLAIFLPVVLCISLHERSASPGLDDFRKGISDWWHRNVVLHISECYYFRNAHKRYDDEINVVLVLYRKEGWIYSEGFHEQVRDLCKGYDANFFSKPGYTMRVRGMEGVRCVQDLLKRCPPPLLQQKGKLHTGKCVSLGFFTDFGSTNTKKLSV